ncbi:SRPBCC family protein [Allokutzneria oryzae]|uniref:SRPBCC family protein n=1 Tax=Allokutzneria oryzae TaxID=1378989 RepID=A0ABV6A326_9PSEU
MTEVRGRAEVPVPVGIVQSHWHRVDSYPEFMRGVRGVYRDGGELTRWDVELPNGEHRELTVRVIPRERGISMSVVDGPRYEVVLLWRPLPNGRTRITWRVWAEPDSELGTPKDLALRFQGDLERFADRMVSLRGLRIDHGEAWLKDPCGGRQPVAL